MALNDFPVTVGKEIKHGWVVFDVEEQKYWKDDGTGCISAHANLEDAHVYRTREKARRDQICTDRVYRVQFIRMVEIIPGR